MNLKSQLLALIITYIALCRHAQADNEETDRDEQDEDTTDGPHNNRRAILSLDAFKTDICGKANFNEDFMKKFNSFSCKRQGNDSNVSWRNLSRRSRLRIAEGYEPKLGDFPSMVQVKFTAGRFRQMTCGGVLIHDDLVLTAAHCLPNRLSTPGFVIVGSIEANMGTKIRILDHCRSRNYNSRESTGDWAILKLSESVTYNESVQPACLDFYRPPALNVACVTAGFGLTDDYRMSPSMRASVMSPCRASRQWQGPPGTTCYQRFPGNFWSGNTCKGDSGSPMYCFDNCKRGKTIMYAVATLTSGTSPVCGPGRVDYSFFTDVYKQGQNGMYQQIEACIHGLRSANTTRRRRATSLKMASHKSQAPPVHSQ